jgi:hypothetical protein
MSALPVASSIDINNAVRADSISVGYSKNADGEFEFIGSETSIFRQIGNAVPPMLAMALGESIKQIKPGNLKTKMDLSHHLKNIGRAFHYKEGQV